MIRFLGIELETTKDTFIPRPETELLVQVCLEAIKEPYTGILDVGTGSGNIAIALAKQDRTCKITALEKSNDALTVAKRNAQHFGVLDRITFVEGDLFSNLHNAKFDIIVSNPPYVPRWEIATLASHVKKEPYIALDGGEDGLDFYKRIIEGTPRFLKAAGLLIMELGYNQAHRVKTLLEREGFSDIELYKDFAGINRIIKARWTNS